MYRQTSIHPADPADKHMPLVKHEVILFVAELLLASLTITSYQYSLVPAIS